MNYGSDNFFADLEGVSVDLAVPQPATFGLSVSSRMDVFNRRTYQLSPFWSAPFKLGILAMSFDGFMHVAGLDRDGPDVITVPQLVLDVASFARRLEPGALMVGLEWYFHGTARRSASAPQVLIKWT